VIRYTTQRTTLNIFILLCCLLYENPVSVIRGFASRLSLTADSSLVRTVPVYAPVHSGSVLPTDLGEPVQIVNEFKCVHTFPAVLRTRPCLGQKVITDCLLCYGLRRCIPGVAPDALRSVPVRPDTPRLSPGHRCHASHGSRTAKPRCYTVAFEYQW